ncbi:MULTISPECIES: tyrosine-type recombinase/integrase [unclassified Streptococcus]|uniref:tyrosine-type recombinase/integrase n=1 Tax=unclassified Streptococcus TaxID=2608887 RepID=UPI00211B19C8|nr:MULTISPECIES: tyrosine-type recombinase/integrase [unclassified Streptococcus]MCQ9211831.1 tyrosine-type recombinase/integrase [Streptococcus sp. B01]MCQ9212951.1 tyrosine-type recombinase/integrase [Streptococcus sp. O1]
MVEPIRSRDDVEAIMEYLQNESSVRENNGERNLLMFLVGVNAGLRIGDIVKLKVRNVKGWYIVLVDEKTGKNTKRKMPKTLKNRMRKYIEDKKDNDFLFPSREGGHLSPNAAYKIIKKAAQEVGLDNIATHSLRKTFGHFMYEQTKDVALIMNLLNHSSQSVSLRYIGKNQDSQDQAMTKFKGF